MTNKPGFNSTNPFANMPSLQIKNTSPKPPYIRRGSTTRAAPKAPGTPSKLNTNESQMRQQMWRYENMYKQTKNQLEVLKVQSKSKDKELNRFKEQKRLIESNHSNIVLWQQKLANLELEKQNLMDKNGLFLQQKNEYLLQLADAQQKCEEFRIEIDCKDAEIENLSSELTNSSQSYTQQLSKKESKYQNLKKEYNELKQSHLENKQINTSITEQLHAMSSNYKEIKQDHTLTKHSLQKLQIEHDILKKDHHQSQTQISQLKGDSTIAMQLAQKRDKNIIKDLRQTLKAETIKSQEYRAECMQLKDELNDLREWREHYLQQQTLTHKRIASSDTSEDVADNISTTSSTSNATASSKNSITIKNKFKILTTKSVNAISNSVSDLFHELGLDDDEKTNDVYLPLANSTNTKEHNEVIKALSDRLAIVKENYMNVKQVAMNKDKDIDRLKCELGKNKEMIADLIEKLNDKPLPPKPTEIADSARPIRRLPKGPPPQPPPVIVSPSYNKGMQHDIVMMANQSLKIMKDTVHKPMALRKNNYSNHHHHEEDEDEVMLGDGI